MCAEILRGVGAVLLHPLTGRRFVDELGRRDHISNTMLAARPEEPNFVVLLNAKSAAIADKHVPLYTNKGLLKKYDSLADMAAAFGMPVDNVTETIQE